MLQGEYVCAAMLLIANPDCSFPLDRNSLASGLMGHVDNSSFVHLDELPTKSQNVLFRFRNSSFISRTKTDLDRPRCSLRRGHVRTQEGPQEVNAEVIGYMQYTIRVVFI